MTYRQAIGTGGIGTGLIFHLEGSHTLGREESRSGRLSDARDYCKGHIVMHYLARLSGCACTLIGMVGDDSRGRELLADMSGSSLDISHICVTDKAPTLLSICFEYPDHSGGNLTASNSASALVDEKYVSDCVNDIRIDKQTIILAMPEVPIAARMALMRIGKERNALVAGSFLSNEIGEMIQLDALRYLDILAVNRDEARLISGAAADTPAGIAAACCAAARKINPDLRLVVTVGSSGAFLFEGSEILHVPIIKVPVQSTGGAGDAFIAGILCGMARGVPFFQAAVLGNIVSSLAVMSRDSIAREAHPAGVMNFMNKYGYGEELAGILQAAD